MFLIGKAAQLFEDFIEGKDGDINPPQWLDTLVDDILVNLNTIEYFNQLPLNMKWGVYQDFSDSMNIRLDVKSKWTDLKDGSPIVIYELFIRGELHSPWQSRDEAYREGLEQLMKSIN